MSDIVLLREKYFPPFSPFKIASVQTGISQLKRKDAGENIEISQKLEEFVRTYVREVNGDRFLLVGKLKQDIESQF